MNRSYTTHLKDASLFRQQAFIDGQWSDSISGKFFAVENPATGEIITEVSNCNQADAQRAIQIAVHAFSSWRFILAKERSAILRRWYEQICLHVDDLAYLMTIEQGKPLAEAKNEVLYAASFLEWFSEQAKRVLGETIPSPAQNRKLIVLKEPVGVSVAITPWNFPLAMIARKVGPALAAGCTIIVKPAEQTPLSALAMAELGQRAGVPAGVFQVLPADNQASIDIGKTLCASELVRKISFTGSTEVGRILMQQSAPTIKKLSLELGGQAPFIVFEDADIEAAVEGAVAAKYRNSGQTCVCANRFYIHEHVYEKFSQGLIARTRQLQVGNGLNKDVQQGPLIDNAAILKVERHIQDALDKGAILATGGKKHALGARFFEPTVLLNVKENMLCVQEETFGPVSPVLMFSDENAVIAAANNSPFGLASYFYTRDIGRTWRVAEQLEFGMVGINTGLLSNESSPFGGIKQSGLGREGSTHGIDEYLNLKYLCMGY